MYQDDYINAPDSDDSFWKTKRKVDEMVRERNDEPCFNDYLGFFEGE